MWVIGAVILDNDKCNHFKNRQPSVGFRIGQINPHAAGSTLGIHLENATRPINIGRGRELTLNKEGWPTDLPRGTTPGKAVK